MGVHRGEKCFFGGISSQIVASVLLVVGGVLAASAGAAATDPLILFNHESDGALVYSYFDTADPGMAYPADIGRLPNGKACKTLGLFNGMLYVGENDGKLSGIDLGSGEKFVLNMSISEPYVQEGPMIYMPPAKDSPEVVRMIDLRGPFSRTVVLPSDSAKRRNPYYATEDQLRYFYHDGSRELHENATANDVDILHCTIDDLRSPESPPLRFFATVQAAGQTWRIEPTHWKSPGLVDPNVVLVRYSPQFGNIPFTWIGSKIFCCVALSLEVDGFTWEGEGDGGPSLFILDLPARSGRVLPLSTLPLRTPLDPQKGGPDPNWYVIDSRNMKLFDQNGRNDVERVEVLSEHFSISRKTGPMRLLHGAQPLAMNREQDVSHAEVDASGERVLLKFPRVSVCYDIYNGYYAECVSLSCLQFVDRDQLHRVEIPVPAGWNPLLQQPIAGWTRDEVPSGRRDRAKEYTLMASSGKSAYAEGETVSIQVILTLAGTEARWTDGPIPNYPLLTGTLASPVHATTLAKIASLKPVQPAAPIYLDPGGVLSETFEFVPEAPGAYSLALAYGGNAESEWYGRAKAPLVRFTVGDATVVPNARLRYAIEDFIKRRGKMEDKFFDELKGAGDEGADLLAGMLLEMSMPDPQTELSGDDDIHKHWSSVMSLYNYLADLRSPRMVPFFKELLGSDNRDKKSRGLFGIQVLHKRSKDPKFRAEMEAIVRDAYADDEPSWRAGAEKDLGVTLFPRTSRGHEGQDAGK